MRICIVTDNEFIFFEFLKIIEEKNQKEWKFDFFYSVDCLESEQKFGHLNICHPIRLNEQNEDFFCLYDLFFSMHCKQIFPNELVLNHRCINIHPGYNPYNRGWYPHVFSIINKYPSGVTIHEMDLELDHGAVIFQQEVPIYECDTSLEVYSRIQKCEVEMLREYLEKLVIGEYETYHIENKGNLNYKKDFEKLCEIDLHQSATYGEMIDFLRATTFKGYNNAYFYGSDGKKVYVNIELIKEC